MTLLDNNSIILTKFIQGVTAVIDDVLIEEEFNLLNEKLNRSKQRLFRAISKKPILAFTLNLDPFATSRYSKNVCNELRLKFMALRISVANKLSNMKFNFPISLHVLYYMPRLSAASRVYHLFKPNLNEMNHTLVSALSGDSFKENNIISINSSKLYSQNEHGKIVVSLFDESYNP